MVFLSKLGDLKKKKGLHRNLKVFFRPKSEIQGFFSGRILVISKQKKNRSSPKFKGFFRPKSEIQGFVSGRNQKLLGFFLPNAGDFQKKKGLHRNLNWFFRPKSEIQEFFFGRMQVISNKKKGLHQNSKSFSCRNQKFKGFFWPKSGDLQKIGLHRLWVSS